MLVLPVLEVYIVSKDNEGEILMVLLVCLLSLPFYDILVILGKFPMSLVINMLTILTVYCLLMSFLKVFAVWQVNWKPNEHFYGNT